MSIRVDSSRSLPFLVVQIGTFGADDSKLDDVGVESVSQFRWFVSSVQVRIRP